MWRISDEELFCFVDFQAEDAEMNYKHAQFRGF
jgi:hypothetical protein